jgi:hypothetical protein
MTVTVALAGDTMLGRGVARALATTPPEALVAPEVRAVLDQADLVVLNLECCISDRGRPWDAPGKPFFFGAAGAGVRHGGIGCFRRPWPAARPRCCPIRTCPTPTPASTTSPPRWSSWGSVRRPWGRCGMCQAPTP